MTEQKLRGQTKVLRQFPESESAHAVVERPVEELKCAEPVEQLRALEEQAAGA